MPIKWKKIITENWAAFSVILIIIVSIVSIVSQGNTFVQGSVNEKVLAHNLNIEAHPSLIGEIKEGQRVAIEELKRNGRIQDSILFEIKYLKDRINDMKQ